LRQQPREPPEGKFRILDIVPQPDSAAGRSANARKMMWRKGARSVGAWRKIKLL
jgi:hypothetical protein